MKRLMLFAACIFFLLNTNAQKNRLKKEWLAERNRQIEKMRGEKHKSGNIIIIR